ncbi:hypothetical protein C0Q70_18910 [Pomacea canaliculata]|uniref:SCP domain-containing protein n=1 Tax=Pomacea canaliculata TaxID=400727 RepID=A0A2T7NHU6_POMCA|nr:hypothetical protein C0Q70_18910 [Pomacea canaliculata]
MIPTARKVLLLAVIVLLQSATVCLKSQEVEYLMSSSIDDEDDYDDAASEWEEELADIAQCHATRCEFRHNNMEARKLHSSGGWISQNLGVVFADDKWLNVSGHVRGWFREGRDYNFTAQKCMGGKKCGHYTAMNWATTRWVGCGVAECRPIDVTTQKRTSPVGTILVCNYRPGGNIAGQVMYKTGGKACSSCDAGQTCAEGLCKTPGCKGTFCKKGVELMQDVCACKSTANPVCPGSGSGSGTKKLALDKMIFTASTLATVLLATQGSNVFDISKMTLAIVFLTISRRCRLHFCRDVRPGSEARAGERGTVSPAHDGHKSWSPGDGRKILARGWRC